MAAAAAAVGWQRLAGVSGAAAVGLGAYGAHGLQGKDPTWKHIYDTASRYHLVHSAALLAAPHARRPHLAGALLSSGMALFCTKSARVTSVLPALARARRSARQLNQTRLSRCVLVNGGVEE